MRCLPAPIFPVSRAAHSAHAGILTGLQLVGFGQAFPDSSNHFAHERIVFQAHSARNGLFKREADIVGTNASRDRHKGLKFARSRRGFQVQTGGVWSGTTGLNRRRPYSRPITGLSASDKVRGFLLFLQAV